VRAAAHVDIFLVVVHAHRGFIGHVVDQAKLVVFAALSEKVDDFGAGQHALDDVVVFCDQLIHARLDRGHVLRREGTLIGDVVVKPGLDHRADDHARCWIELLYGVPDQVGAGVTDDFQPFVVLRRDDLEPGVALDQVTGVDKFPVYLAGQCDLGETGADRGSHLGDRHRAGEFAL